MSIDHVNKDINVNRSKGDSTDGKTDYERLKNMTEKDIEENAKSDPPLLNDEDLKKFKKVKYLEK